MITIEFYISIISLIISLSILNVWLIRFNKPTTYRGGDAITMKEEFATYGLPDWSLYFIGSIKVLLSLIIIYSVFIEETFDFIICYYIMSFLMIGAIIMHFKIKDPIKKSLPAISILTLLLTIIYLSNYMEGVKALLP